MTSDLPLVLVTGRLWLGADGACSIGSTLVELVDSATQEVIIVAYRLTVAVSEFVQALEGALARGCYVRIVVDQPSCADVENRFLSRLLRNYKTIAVWDFCEISGALTNYSLHAKMVVVDRAVAIVGSANFSRNGVLENHEIGLRVTGATASSLAFACDALIENGTKEGVLTKRLGG